MFGRKYQVGDFASIQRNARIGHGSRIGHWAKIAEHVQIGAGCVIGDWSSLGSGCVVGDHAHFGNWAKAGAGAIIGQHAILGSHTRVQPGATVPPHARLGDCDLVTPHGIIPNRCGGHAMSFSSDLDPELGEPCEVTVSALGATFVVPHATMAEVEQMIDNFMWGASDELENYRLPPALSPEPDEPACPAM